MLKVRRDTLVWRRLVGLSFGTVVTLSGIGLARRPGNDLDRAGMVAGWTFCRSTAFAPTTTRLDAHEADIEVARQAGRVGPTLRAENTFYRCLTVMKEQSMSAFRTVLCPLLLSLGLASAPASQAQSNVSDASALSLMPVAISVAAPAMLLVGGVMLTVVAVEVSATGSVWVLERASDGARASLRFAGHVLAASGAAIVVTAVATGWVLSAAGAAIAFVPNEIGRALLHNERISR